jgi:hypothetical protein
VRAEVRDERVLQRVGEREIDNGPLGWDWDWDWDWDGVYSGIGSRQVALGLQ